MRNVFRIFAIVLLFTASSIGAFSPYFAYKASAYSCGFGTAINGECVGFLISSTGVNQTWTVPNDWNSSNNTIECIGGGASGGTGSGSVHGTGGGGGEYGLITNFSTTPGSSITYQIGAGGSAVSNTASTPGNDGGSTWFNGASQPAASLGCIGGTHGVAGSGSQNGGAGGTGGVGTTHNAGGRGGNMTGASGGGGSGGGGAGGSTGVGGNGGDNSSTGGSQVTNGGSADTGSASGGAGGAGNVDTPGSGGAGFEWDFTHGSGGGGGSASHNTTVGGSGGNYGGGGGASVSGVSSQSGAGIQGIIVVTYDPMPIRTIKIFEGFRLKVIGKTLKVFSNQ